MPRPRRLIPLSVTALALVATGCGQADKGKITAAQADKLNASVERADSQRQDDQCGAARASAQTGAQKVTALKGNVDPKLRNNLLKGFERLDQRIASECDKPEETATPSPTTTVEPTATEAPTTTPTATPSPTPTATPSPTPTVEPTTTPTPDNGSGGTGTDDESGGSSSP